MRVQPSRAPNRLLRHALRPRWAPQPQLKPNWKDVNLSVQFDGGLGSGSTLPSQIVVTVLAKLHLRDGETCLRACEDGEALNLLNTRVPLALAKLWFLPAREPKYRTMGKPLNERSTEQDQQQ